MWLQVPYQWGNRRILQIGSGTKWGVGFNEYYIPDSFINVVVHCIYKHAEHGIKVVKLKEKVASKKPAKVYVENPETPM